MILDIAAPNTPEHEPAVRGQWHNLRWKPNESTGELLNIGVVLRTAEGAHVKLLESFERLRCLYDGHVADDAKFLVRVVRDAVLADAEMPSRSVYLSEPKFAAGASISEILDQLFRATVPLGARKTGDRAQDENAQPAADTTSVRREVLNALRDIAGLDADRIITPERTMQVIEDGRVHQLDIPLQTHSALGTIVSARYAQTKDTELNILRADSDLQIARKVYRQDRLYMYVVRPDVEANADKADKLLEEFSWKFRQIGVAMKSYTHPELVARDILEDMPAH